MYIALYKIFIFWGDIGTHVDIQFLFQKIQREFTLLLNIL